MNRRAFLQRGSLAAIAAAGLPAGVKASRRQQEPAATNYRTASDGTAGQVLYGISIFQHGVEDFKNAKAEEKIIKLSIKQYDTTDRTTASKSSDYNLTLEKAEEVKNNPGLYKLSVKVEKLRGDYDLPKDMAKKMTLEYIPGSFVQIRGKKDTLVSELAYVAPSAASSGDGDCFLTTACVHHKRLTDDCLQLQTLRALREGHMRGTSEGKILIAQYRTLGPAIVAAINECSNRAEIYEYMYAEMILPSVRLVQSGRHEEAVMHYKTFVKALKKQYC